MQFNFLKIHKSLKVLKIKITFFVAFCNKLAHSNRTVRKVLADLRKETKQ